MQPHKVLIASEGIGASGGVAVFTRDLAARLRARGWEVERLATSYRGDGFDAQSVDLPCHDLSPMRLSLGKVRAAADLVKLIGPDVLVLNHCPLLHYALPLLAARTRPVVVLHSDDPRYHRTASRCHRRVFRWIAPTPGVAGQFAKYIPRRARQRVRVVPHGVSAVFGPPPESDDARAARAFVFVGYVAENKGAHLLPDVMRRVADRCPGVQLTIVGDGPLRPWLESEFTRRGLRENVCFAGTLSPAGVGDVMRGAGVLLLPTFIEGFGLVIAEAMTCGLVPVVSRLRGVTDWVVRHGETGVLVGPGDTSGFADVLVQLAQHPGQLRMLGDAARADALRRFSAVGMIEAYEQLLAEVDGRRREEACGPAQWLAGVAWQVLKERVGRIGLAHPAASA